MRTTPPPPPPSAPPLARTLGPVDAVMIVMGGIVGAGIFMNPSVVARAVHSPAAILLAWVVGGAIALVGAFVYAELAVWRPHAGGQYVYLRDAFHPMVAFLYGWTLLLVVQTGGMAAVAMTFASYARELTGATIPAPWIAVGALALLTAVNCLGARTGSNVQTTLMALKIAAITMLVTVGWLALGEPPSAMSAAAVASPDRVARPALLAFGAAMVPVLFAYGGWQTASFVSGELRDPARDLPRGLLLGVLGVVVLYVAVNLVCLLVLGPDALAATSTPASEVMRRALGPTGARLIAAGIAVSTIGFLSQGMLTAPRVYWAMARDGLFFRRVGDVHPRTQAPVVAIVLQGAWASVIALSGRYEQILHYVVAIDALFFGLTGAALLVFRRREAAGTMARSTTGARMPLHPASTLLFTGAFFILALNTVLQFPRSAGIGVLILLAGVPAFFAWRRGAVRAIGVAALVSCALSSSLMLAPRAAGAQAAPARTRPAARGAYVPGPGDQWVRRTPAEAGLDSARLAAAIAFAVASESKVPRNLELAHYQGFGREPFGQAVGPFRERGDPTGIVLRGGYLVAQWGDPERVDMTFSVTKSFLSTTVGLAFDRGMLRLDERVADRVGPVLVAGVRANAPDRIGSATLLAPFDTPHNRTITWDHLLRQVSDWEGTLWGKPDWADRPTGPPAEWRTRARVAPGSAYEYNDVRVNALALAALEVWRRPLPQVLREEVMDPIGASNTWRWTGYDESWVVLDGQMLQSVSGGGHWGGGMFINARDLARFGLLTQRRGRWGDRQLLSEAWVRAALTPTPAQPTYGFMNWFLNTDRKLWPSAPATAFGHVGNGTNLVYVDPEHDLVVVVRWIENAAIDGFLQRVLASVQK